MPLLNDLSNIEILTGRERELKFTLGSLAFKLAESLPLFGQSGDGLAPQHELTVYYDTDALDLHRRKIALRVRQIGDNYVMALKWLPGSVTSVFERGEVNVALTSPEPDLALFGEEVAAGLERFLRGKRLRPVFTSEIQRSVRTVKFEGATIEVALDVGFIIAGAKRERVRELELELKSGDLSALYMFGQQVLDALNVSLGVLSKAERGAYLVSGEGPKPVRAVEPDIAQDSSVEDAIGIILHNCLAQFTGNWPGSVLGDRPEAVHQMRIAMSRLRAALGFFQRVFPNKQFQHFRNEARRICSALEQARDWDVLEEMVRSGPLATFAETPGFVPLLEVAHQKSQDGHIGAQEMLRNKSVTRFILRLEEFIASRDWSDNIHRAKLDDKISNFAAQCLERLDRRVIKCGQNFEMLAPDARHKLRIALKNLCCANDFFGHQFRPRATVLNFGRRAAHLQYLLGQFNDARVATNMIRGLELSANPELAYAGGLTAGWYGCKMAMEETFLRSAWQSFLKCERYWTAQEEAEESDAEELEMLQE